MLDDWGNRFTSLGASVPENALRTQVRTTIAQLAMFDAVNAVLDGPYRPFASKPVVGSRCITGSCGDPCSVHRRPQRVPDENRDDRRAPTTRRSPAFPRALKRSPMASWSARPQPMRCSRRALEITATIRSSRATRPAAAPVCGSRLHPHSRIRRLRSFGSSRRSGMTTPRASVPMLRQRSTAGPTRSTTTRARTSVGPPRRAEPPSSLRRHCSGRHRRARCGAPTSAAWPARWTY